MRIATWANTHIYVPDSTNIVLSEPQNSESLRLYIAGFFIIVIYLFFTSD